MTHLEARLEKDLNAIRELIMDQAEKVTKAVDDSIRAVQTSDPKLAYATVLGDHAINRQMREIDRLCHSFIAIHLPSAGPLRLLSSIIRANVELERMGDYAVTISREAVQMSHPPLGHMAQELERVGSATSLMLHQSVSAFKELNTELARGTTVMADQLEHNMDAVYEELMSNSEKERVKDLLATFVIFNQIKRVADLSKNLCEHTIFAATGLQKSDKVFNVMFVDSDGSRLAPLAEAIASNNFSNSGRYRGVAFEPAATIDSKLTAFLGNHGMSSSNQVSSSLGSVSGHDMGMQHVIVCLEVGMEECMKVAPFHTSVLEWGLEQTEDIESLYREMAPRIRDLMELLRGEGAD